MDNLIEIKNLSYSYPGLENEDLYILHDINFDVKKGEFVGIIGHNGSGKTTLAKLINAIILPSKGDVIIDGMNTKDSELLWDIRKTAGMVFQNPDNQLVAAIVEDDVAFGPENLGVQSEKIRTLVDEALQSVSMSEFSKKKPHQLSGGQKQRIAIAGILAMQPKCIVFDEATAMLDPVGRKEVLDTAIKLRNENNLTILYITHYMSELIAADKIIVLDSGRIVMQGKPKEVFSHVKELKAIGLEVPQMTELTYRLNNSGFNLPNDILSIEEMVGALCH